LSQVWFALDPVSELNLVIIGPPEVVIPEPVTQAYPDVLLQNVQLTRDESYNTTAIHVT